MKLNNPITRILAPQEQASKELWKLIPQIAALAAEEDRLPLGSANLAYYCTLQQDQIIIHIPRDQYSPALAELLARLAQLVDEEDALVEGTNMLSLDCFVSEAPGSASQTGGIKIEPREFRVVGERPSDSNPKIH